MEKFKSKYEIDISGIDRLLTVEEVAPLLQIPPSSIYKILSGERSFPIPEAVRLGRFWRFKLSAVVRFLAELGATEVDVDMSAAQEFDVVEEKSKRGRPRLQTREMMGVTA